MNKRPYYGNARFIEIGSPGILFRYLVNLDKIDGVRFEENIQTVPVEGDLDAMPEVISAGWTVVLLIGGQQHGINFPIVEAAIACYNSILDMTQMVGVPLINITRLEAPPKPSSIVDAKGKKMKSLLEGANEAIQQGIEAGEEGEDLLDSVLDPGESGVIDDKGKLIDEPSDVTPEMFDPIVDDEGEMISITDEQIEELEQAARDATTPDPKVN